MPEDLPALLFGAGEVALAVVHGIEVRLQVTAAFEARRAAMAGELLLLVRSSDGRRGVGEHGGPISRKVRHTMDMDIVEYRKAQNAKRSRNGRFIYIERVVERKKDREAHS